MLSWYNIAFSLVCTLAVITGAAVMQVQSSDGQIFTGSVVSNAAILGSSSQQAYLFNPQNSTELLEPGVFTLKVPEKFDSPPQQVSRTIQDELSSEQASCRFYRYISQQAEGEEYTIGFAHFPHELFEEGTLDEIRRDLKEGELLRLKGSLREERSVTPTTGQPRLELFVYSEQKGVFTRSAIYLNRPYALVLSYSTPDAQRLLRPEIIEYFDSPVLSSAVPERITIY